MSDWGFVKFSILMGIFIGVAASAEVPIYMLLGETPLNRLASLCCCLPAMFGGAAVVSLTLIFEKGATMRTGQAALVGFLAGIISIPVYYVSAVLIDFLIVYLMTLKVGSGSELGLFTVFGGSSFVKRLFSTLAISPLSLILPTLAAVVSLHLFHNGRINRA